MNYELRIMNCLKWQVVCCRGCLEGSCVHWGQGCYLSLGSCLCLGSGLRCSSGSAFLHGLGSCLAAVDAEGTDIVEPAAIVLVGVDVEVYGQQFAYLNVECLQAFSSEDVEHKLPGEVAGHFHYV